MVPVVNSSTRNGGWSSVPRLIHIKNKLSLFLITPSMGKWPLPQSQSDLPSDVIKCLIFWFLQLLSPSAFHCDSLSLWRPQNREVIVQIQKDSSQNMPANGSRKCEHNGPKWPGWESFIATDGALQKKRGNDTTELMKKLNPFHKWILDVWGSLLFKNCKADFLNFPFLLHFIHPKTNNTICNGVQKSRITQGGGHRLNENFELVQNLGKWHICYEWALCLAPFPHSQYVHWLSLHIKLNMWREWLIMLTDSQCYTSHRLIASLWAMFDVYIHTFCTIALQKAKHNLI